VIAGILAYDISGKPQPVGNGVLVAPDAIVTTCHGLPPSATIVARVGVESVPATVAIFDEDLDLCRLTITPVSARPVVPNTDEPKVGDKVFVVGYHEGTHLSVVEGAVKAVRSTNTARMIDLSVPVPAGASGGGLFDAYGRLIGVLTDKGSAATAAATLPQMRTRGQPRPSNRPWCTPTTTCSVSSAMLPRSRSPPPFRERMDEFKNRTYAGTHGLDDVREAYRVLSNNTVRAGYDETLPARRRAAKKEGGVPGWMKWALPVVIVAAGLAWMKWSKPREPVMTVKSVSRVSSDYDPTRPAPVTIAPPVPGNAFESTASASNLPASWVPRRACSRAPRRVSRACSCATREANPVSQGSGVVIGPGVVITNCHVTRNGSEISVKVGNDEYRASVSAEDNEHDLCKLSVTGLSAPAVSLGSVANLKPGSASSRSALRRASSSRSARASFPRCATFPTEK
jgi:S1-C subfamily serine protease